MRGLDIDEFSQEGLLCAPVADTTIVVASLACCRNRAERATPVTHHLTLYLARQCPAALAGSGAGWAYARIYWVFVPRNRSLGSIDRYRLRRITRQYC